MAWYASTNSSENTMYVKSWEDADKARFKAQEDNDQAARYTKFK
jgi:hypothetical protein